MYDNSLNSQTLTISTPENEENKEAVRPKVPHIYNSNGANAINKTLDHATLSKQIANIGSNLATTSLQTNLRNSMDEGVSTEESKRILPKLPQEKVQYIMKEKIGLFLPSQYEDPKIAYQRKLQSYQRSIEQAAMIQELSRKERASRDITDEARLRKQWDEIQNREEYQSYQYRKHMEDCNKRQEYMFAQLKNREDSERKELVDKPYYTRNNEINRNHAKAEGVNKSINFQPNANVFKGVARNMLQ